MPHLDTALDVVIEDDDRCPSCGGHSPGSLICPDCVRGVDLRKCANPTTKGKYGLDADTRAMVAPGKSAKEPAALVKREMARREMARRHFLPFITRLKPDYKVGWFHQDLAARLERFVLRVERGESPRMIINVPPRRGKSEQAKALVAWFLGRNPTMSVISTTHSDDLAYDNSRDVLNYIKDEKFAALFPGVELSKDNKGAAGWRTTDGGRFKPAGAGKGIAGRGGHVILVDDPHKDKEAYSVKVRDSIWRWYKASLRTRVMDGGGIIIIQTRWVDDDLTGRVLEDQGTIAEGGVWEHVIYPEEAVHDEYRLPSGLIVTEPVEGATLLRRTGDCLDPVRYPASTNIEHKQDPVTWAALFQQNPVSGDAALFTEEMFANTYLPQEKPSRMVNYSTWDLAVAQEERNDWTVSLPFGMDSDGVIWIHDMLRERMNSLEIVNAMIDQHFEYDTEVDGAEDGHISKSIGPFLQQHIDDRGALNMSVEPLKVANRDKVARAQSILALLRQGKVRLPAGAPWLEVMKDEALKFPGGKHDDIVDALAWIGLMIKEVIGPSRPKPKRQKSWRDKLDKYVKGGATKKDWRSA